MTDSIQITIIDGPRSFFNDQLPNKNQDQISLPQIARLLDDINRTFRIQTNDGDKISEIDRSPSTHRIVFARSNDYASISEHVRLNFVEFINEIEPQALFLHNPPRHIREQITSSFDNVSTKVFDYPKITEKDIEQLKTVLPTYILGQEVAINSLLASFQTMIDLDNKKPLVLLFIGPSGVGKTETAKQICNTLNGQVMRKQFSMFQNDSFTSYLFGGELRDDSFGHDLLDRTSNIILLDEFDKANPIFHSAFYQLFDEGKFSERNYSVNVNRAIIICTSNYASKSEAKNLLGEAIYSRFDSIVQFSPLSTFAVEQLIDNAVEDRFKKTQNTYLNKQEIVATLKSRASHFHNARSLRRFVNEYISLQKMKKTIK